MKGLTLSFEIVSPVSQLLSEVYEVSTASEIFLCLSQSVPTPGTATVLGSVTVDWFCLFFSCKQMERLVCVLLNCCLVPPGAPGAEMRLRRQGLGAAWPLE